MIVGLGGALTRFVAFQKEAHLADKGRSERVTELLALSAWASEAAPQVCSLPTGHAADELTIRCIEEMPPVGERKASVRATGFDVGIRVLVILEELDHVRGETPGRGRRLDEDCRRVGRCGNQAGALALRHVHLVCCKWPVDRGDEGSAVVVEERRMMERSVWWVGRVRRAATCVGRETSAS